MFQWPKFIGSRDVIRFSCAIKTKYLPMRPTHDDTIETKKVNSQLSFERYDGKLMLRN